MKPWHLWALWLLSIIASRALYHIFDRMCKNSLDWDGYLCALSIGTIAWMMPLALPFYLIYGNKPIN